MKISFSFSLLEESITVIFNGNTFYLNIYFSFDFTFSKNIESVLSEISYLKNYYNGWFFKVISSDYFREFVSFKKY